MTTDEQKFIRLTRLTREEPQVNHEEPWADDRLKRQPAAEALTNLIRTQSGPFVVCLDGDWGTGKTFFLKRWKRQLEIDGMRVVYFNAWQDDFFEDPLVPMLAQIMDMVGDVAIRKAISEPVKALVYRNVQSVTHKLTGVTLPNFGDDILETYNCQVKHRERLRRELENLSTDRLVFIVDELDRCRPDFAIATLERTKHVLDIPGLIFVYGINRREMCKSIASVYGDIDTDVYVRRFFDMEFTLPVSDPRDYCSYLTKQYDMQIKVDNARLNDGVWFIEAVPEVLNTIGDLSLRDVEQCIRIATFAIINMAHGKGIFHYKTIVAVIVVRLVNSELYQRFAHGEHVAGQMIDFLAKCTRRSSGIPRWLVDIQGPLYAVCDESVPDGYTASGELTRLLSADSTTEPVLLANATTSLSKAQLGEVLSKLERWRQEVSELGGRFILDRQWRRRLVGLLDLATGT